MKLGALAKALSSHGVVAFAAIALLIVIRRSTRGNFLNSYPFISPDGFDWIFEGVYLHHLITDGLGAMQPAIILRAPLFVLVTMMDALASSRGIVLAVGFALSLLISGIFLILMLEDFAVRWWLRLWAALVFVLSPFGHFRGWVLSDAMAIAFMHVNVYSLLRYQRTGAPSWLIIAALTMCLGGWTQTYAIIPFLIGIAVIGLSRLTSRASALRPTLVALSAVAVYVVGLLIWHRTIPHDAVPMQFGLLQFKLDMLQFYANVWPFYFGPFSVALGYYLLSLRAYALSLRVDVVIVVLSVGAFALLLLVYQWPDARFSYFYFGLVVVIAALMLEHGSLQRLRGAATALCLLLVLITSFVLVPQNYWNPDLKALQVAPRSSWLVKYLTAAPIDRFLLVPSCGGTMHFCPASVLILPYDAYATRILQDYRRIMIEKDRSR